MKARRTSLNLKTKDHFALQNRGDTGGRGGEERKGGVNGSFWWILILTSKKKKKDNGEEGGWCFGFILIFIPALCILLSLCMTMCWKETM